MTIPDALFNSSISNLKQLSRGKVRDIYEVDNQHLLMVTTDRLSAFDVILPDPIPGKGRILTNIANFWFTRTREIIRNHLSSLTLAEIVTNSEELTMIEGRAVVVKRLKPLPIEAIVRGYIIGSGWQEYQQSGAICGISLPADLKLAQQLPQPIYTPSSKAVQGKHDENIDFAQTVTLLGEELAIKVQEISLDIYTQSAKYARQRGLIIADTKFEFGLDDQGELYLIDEVLTPDSSRFWAAEQYQVGTSPPSFDKQYIRDYLETLDWDKTTPGPVLPQQVIEVCAAKYREAETMLTG